MFYYNKNQVESKAKLTASKNRKSQAFSVPND